ncbi:MAG: PqqD family peptide modification chaperone [Kiritimatiellia bacterium]|nr:PqqD family peptide modification chaperone [Kiritimatiellia bacterium]MDP6630169.1 PqqD family peptide modification chaperone [Kiritimatiellia bacterium]
MTDTQPTPNETRIAWCGWSLPLPDHWRPLKIEGGHAKGSMMIGDGRQPILLVRWMRTHNQRRFDVQRWLAARFRKQGLTPDDKTPQPVAIDHAAWAHDTADSEGGRKTTWYGYAAQSRLLIEIVTTDLTEPAVRDEIFSACLPCLVVTADDEPCTWNLYGISFISPPGYVLRRSHLFSGDIALELARGKRDTLLLRQVYPAGLAVARRTLDRWLQTPPFTERRFWNKHVFANRAPDPGSCSCRGWKRLRSPMGCCSPRFSTAMATIDEAQDRLLIAEHQEAAEHNMDTVELALQQMISKPLAATVEDTFRRRKASRAGTPPTSTTAADPGPGKRGPRITRDAAMAAVPVQIPPRRVEHKGEKRYVTVTFNRGGWQRLFGAARIRERTFGLDPYGQVVYDACDGKVCVETIIRRFAKSHHISGPEAETAVTSFLRLLMKKGLIAMTIERSRAE